MSHSTSVSVGQSGKSGGDAFGGAGSGAGAMAGSGFGIGQAEAGGFGVGAGAGGLGIGGSAGASAGSFGAHGGDVSDNTSIGSININSIHNSLSPPVDRRTDGSNGRGSPPPVFFWCAGLGAGRS